MPPAPRLSIGLVAIAAFLVMNLIFLTLFGVLVEVVELATGPAGFRIGTFRYGGFIEVQAALRSPYPVPGLPPVDAQPVGVSIPGTVTVVFNEPDRGQQLVSEVPEVLLVAVAFSVMVLLLRVVLAALAGEVFVPANARRLLTIALLMVGGGVLVPASQFAATTWLLRSERLTNVDAPIDFPLLPVWGGLILLFFAEVFRRGVRLRQDVEGLV
jgi:hypothetical protein